MKNTASICRFTMILKLNTWKRRLQIRWKRSDQRVQMAISKVFWKEVIQTMISLKRLAKNVFQCSLKMIQAQYRLLHLRERKTNAILIRPTLKTSLSKESLIENKKKTRWISYLVELLQHWSFRHQKRYILDGSEIVLLHFKVHRSMWVRRLSRHKTCSWRIHLISPTFKMKR